MTRSERLVDADVAKVFATLADGYTYSDWVVGTKLVRSVDGNWPAPRSHLHHRVGFGFLIIDGDTEVLEVIPLRRLVLDARAGPFGTARVELDLLPAGRRTVIKMREVVVEPAFLKWLNPLFGPLVQLRNAESLRRLERMVVA